MATFDSVNPARPAEVIGTYPMHGRGRRRRAPSRRPPSAQRALGPGADPGPGRGHRRGRARSCAARKAELAELVSREAGKILVEAGGDVQEAIDMADFVAGQGRAAWGETVPSELGSTSWRGRPASPSASSG